MADPLDRIEQRPWLDDGDVRLYHGDCLDVLRSLPARSVQTCVTSPPYWGLRDYGTDGQIGLERTPQEYVARLVDVFREVRRVLRDDGTLWLNLGDTYNAYNGNSAAGGPVGLTQSAQRPRLESGYGLLDPKLKPKDLVGIPWRVAFALQEDGWWLRSDIVWSKPNPMPESVTDRPTKAHEYVFLLAKQPSYYFDQDAVREPYRYDGRRVLAREAGEGSHPNHRNGKRNRWPGLSADADAVAAAGRNVRSVWEIPTRPFPGAHFAVFPPELARRMIQAGTSERGCCFVCGAPWQRWVSESPNIHPGDSGRTGAQGEVRRGKRADGKAVGTIMRERHDAGRHRTTLGWQPSCECVNGDPESVVAFYQPVPCVVLDPFAGSGTTLKVARDHGRHAVGIELNEDYCRIAADRLAQQSLLTGDAA